MDMPWWMPVSWIGCIVLSAAGGWLLVRGLFGRRRIASRMRRCPKCRYDMTGRPTEMTCPECGLTAKDEATWFGGRRGWWTPAFGTVMLAVSLFILTLPAGLSGGYLSFLPLRARIYTWPTWLRAIDALGLDLQGESNAVRLLPGEIQQAGSEELRLAAWRRGVDYLRHNDPSPALAEEIGYNLAQTPIAAYPPDGTDTRIPADDVLFLLRYPDSFVVSAGVNAAYHAEPGREGEIFDAVVAAASGPFSTEMDETSWVLVELDFLRGGDWVAGVVADLNHPKHDAVVYQLGNKAYAELWQGPEAVKPQYDGTPALDIIREQIESGPPEVATALARALARYSLNQISELDHDGHAIAFGASIRSDPVLVSITCWTRDAFYADDHEVADALLRWLRLGQLYVHGRWLLSGIDKTVADDNVARVIESVLAAVQGSSSVLHLPDTWELVRAVAEDRDRSEVVRSVAAELLAEINTRHPREPTD